MIAGEGALLTLVRSFENCAMTLFGPALRGLNLLFQFGRPSRWLAAAICVALVPSPATAEPRVLAPAATPADNPLKGLVPYARPTPGRFPHSMEFTYLPLSDLMTGPEAFDWQPLERLLDDVASRGNQLIFRVFLEYPDKQEGIPPFLVQQGLKVHAYQNTNTAPLPPAEVRTPDYADPRLRAALRTYIAALGARYDGDPRIAYITAGLLGTWGEWHTYPRGDLWAAQEVQDEVLTAYAQAFRQTPVLLRYPAGPGNGEQTANADRPFGYHDDSFAWATLETGRKQDDWFYLAALRQAGPAAVAKWKTQPIGGEIRPELWGKIFDARPGIPEAQDFAECVRQTHATWLMDTGMFQEPSSTDRFRRAAAQVQAMGYDFHVTRAEIARTGGELSVTADVVNRGVAPFYREWTLELGLLDGQGAVVSSEPVDWSLTRLLPEAPPRKWSARIGGAAAARHVALRVINPLKGGKVFHFANEDQNRHAPGWLTLGPVPTGQ